MAAGLGQVPPPLRAENVILITVDGLRWPEVFGQRPPAGKVPVAASLTPAQRRQALLSFLWDTVATRGQLYGNCAYRNQVNVANYQRFSYPGYQKILTKMADPRVLCDRPVESQRPTVLDFLSEQPGLRSRVAAFTSWATLSQILRASSDNYPVSAGWQVAAGPGLSRREQLNAKPPTKSMPT